MKITHICMMAVLSVLLASCAGLYGRIVHQPSADAPVTIEALTESWETYDVYWGSRDGVRPAALMFDPKSNDTRLTGDSWRKIYDQAVLADTVEKIRLWHRRAELALIKGPDGRTFGFIYYPKRLHVPVKVVDEATLYVMSLPKPISPP